MMSSLLRRVAVATQGHLRPRSGCPHCKARPFSDSRAPTTTTTPATMAVDATSSSASPSSLPAVDMSHLLDAFRDPLPRDKRAEEPVGRRWSAKELRRKSFEDLHKLWLVLYKERNMLLTEQYLSRRSLLRFPQPDRLKKVQKSMGGIRQVLGERKRDKLAQIALEAMDREQDQQPITTDGDSDDDHEGDDLDDDNPDEDENGETQPGKQKQSGSI